jgi:hypothetical protein
MFTMNVDVWVFGGEPRSASRVRRIRRTLKNQLANSGAHP